ncbi:MinD/ParA family protein [Azohydromonas sediminis]|uniref:MinD/ParA family protein n=1 Tax=Azohydromonas sediminis TaxID=2259674 RepID=UPI000E646C57|nr:MinD/ParA family protein [Azohydromonas sediminis]
MTDPNAIARRAVVTAITSGKGGVGKTFVSANLAASLAAAGERVLVLDADLGLANLDVVLNLAPRVTLHDVIAGRAALGDALVDAPGGFTVLPAGSGLVEYSRLTADVRDRLRQVVDELRPRYDRVLLDTGAGISDVVLYTVSLADEVLVVATPEPTSLTDAYATIKVLATTQGRHHVRLVVNQATGAGDGRRVCAQLQRVVARYVDPAVGHAVHIELVGEVPDDASVREAVLRRELLVEVFPGCAAAQALAAAAARMRA